MAGRRQGVQIDRLRYPGTAECERGCLHPDATRERCRAHALAHPGHVVHFVVEDSTRYEYKPAAEEEPA